MAPPGPGQPGPESRARRFAIETKALARFHRQRRPDPVLSPETTEFWSALRNLPRRQAEVLALYYEGSSDGYDRDACHVSGQSA